ncbi:TetR-like C-terminal domain-containing protein [Paractinoplanes globisporus]|uniref:TetR-like C-terminal domain-containing protein n=1 Tax=Paractinoplanes globisporus TaxID=113565 RepID=A0ABW6WN38_9ACTN|nr:TetR-like C-terminal domain-containing protein [Actinoplanes globisporus]
MDLAFDTGDLLAYATGVARDLTTPDGLAALRRAVGYPGERRDAFLAERAGQVQVILDRSRARGEQPPQAVDVVDHILAPIYLRALLGMGPLTPAYIDRLVDRLRVIS